MAPTRNGPSADRQFYRVFTLISTHRAVTFSCILLHVQVYISVFDRGKLVKTFP
jgi:hypothetical protein